eukprot:8202521-Pyramimonas_sp.AAC.1
MVGAVQCFGIFVPGQPTIWTWRSWAETSSPRVPVKLKGLNTASDKNVARAAPIMRLREHIGAAPDL